MPAQYKDLSKSSNDLFNKNYEHGKYSLEINHKSVGFDFKTKSTFSNGAIASSHEQTMDRGQHGKHKGTFTANGSGKVAYDSEFKLLANKNLKLNLLSDWALGPAVNAAFFKDFCAPKELKINFSNDKANLDLSSKFADLKKINGSLVLDNIPKVPTALGANFALDFNSGNASVLSSLELAVNKKIGAAEYNLFFNPLTNAVNLSLYNKVNNDVKLASIVSHDTKNALKFGLAGAINGAAGSSHQFKIDQAGVLAVSHITPTNFGPKLTVSAEFNALKVEDGAKVGAGLKFDL